MKEAAIANLLVDLGIAVRRCLAESRMTTQAASTVVARTSHDAIFAIDRHVEPLLVKTIENWPEEFLPVALFAEGLDDVPVILGGTATDTPRWWLLVDPIDGSRGLMYQKRSAYFLAAAAPGHVSHPKLSDAVASVAVELPTSKAGWADIFVWSVGAGVRGTRNNLTSGTDRAIDEIRPSTAVDLAQAFGSVVAFFPEGKQQAAELAEEIATRAGAAGSAAHIFDDQYISTSGQVIELMTGKDRFIVDLRPYFSAGPSGSRLCCHPYDLAIVPLARAAGVVLLSPGGGPLDAPFALDLDVAWCGYANEDIARIVSPIVHGFIGRLAIAP